MTFKYVNWNPAATLVTLQHKLYIMVHTNHWFNVVLDINYFTFCSFVHVFRMSTSHNLPMLAYVSFCCFCWVTGEFSPYRTDQPRTSKRCFPLLFYFSIQTIYNYELHILSCVYGIGISLPNQVSTIAVSIIIMYLCMQLNDCVDFAKQTSFQTTYLNHAI